jgi:hypothetical protein
MQYRQLGRFGIIFLLLLLYLPAFQSVFLWPTSQVLGVLDQVIQAASPATLPSP